MSENCQLVVFSNKAYNAIIRESFDKDPVETGGILLGHVLDNGVWIVMEVLPPGINSIFQYAYFEYDEAFVNYLAQSVANQYKRPLDLLGLWHRHPGSMDVFSTTDDGTNSTFARQNPAGVISGLVNIDPNFRITMYHLDRPTGRLMGRPNYSVVDVEVGDDIIPDEYFELRYFDGGESNLHPSVAQRARNFQPRQIVAEGDRIPDPNSSLEDTEREANEIDIQRIISGQLPPCGNRENATPKPVNDFFSFWRASNKKWLYVLLAVAALIIGAFTIRSCKESIEGISSWVNGWSQKDKGNKVPQLSVESIDLTLGDSPKAISIINADGKAVEWKSTKPQIAKVDEKGRVMPVSEGNTNIDVYVDGKKIGSCKISVRQPDSTKDDTIDSSTANTDNSTDDETKEDSNVSFVLEQVSGNVKVGESFPLKIQKIGEPMLTFTSSDENVAVVNKKGVVTGKSKGTATITVSQEGAEPCNFELTVK